MRVEKYVKVLRCEAASVFALPVRHQPLGDVFIASGKSAFVPAEELPVHLEMIHGLLLVDIMDPVAESFDGITHAQEYLPDFICAGGIEQNVYIRHLPEGKAVLTGSPIRRELLSGDPEEGRRFCGFDRLPGRAAMPVLMVTGGSLGSVRVNTSIRSILPRLLESFNVVHLCGKGNLDTSLNSRPGYVQFEYVSEQMADLFALADVVVSRAGANSICELLELRKPNLLIPLSAAASRGDQLLNARSFKKQGYSQVLEEEEITDDVLYNSIMDLYKNRRTYIDTMAKSKNSSAIEIILGLIEKASAGDGAGGRN